MGNEIEVLEKESGTLTIKADQIIIKSQEDYEKCATFKKACTELRKKVNETFKPIRDKQYSAYKEIKSQWDKHLLPITQAENTAKSKAKDWENLQFKIQQEAERKARILAEEKAMKERERIERQAEKAIEKGQEEKAETLIEKAEEVVPEPVTVIPTINRVKGMNIRRVWKFKITDEKKIPREYLKVDEVKIGQVVRAMKLETKIEGIRVFEE